MKVSQILAMDFTKLSFDQLQKLIEKIRAAAATNLEVPEKWREKVAEWKGKGKVKHAHVESVGSIFFALPTREQVQAAEELSTDEEGKVDIYAKADQLMADCYLGGDITLEDVFSDTELYMSVAKFALYELVQAKNVLSGLC